MTDRRSSDPRIDELIARVGELDGDVKQLRVDFDNHASNEATKIELLSAALVSIQMKLDQILLDIKDPIEAYKTAKYGVGFMKYIADTAKWLVPIGTGLFIAYAPMNDTQREVLKETVQQIQKADKATGEPK